MSNNKIKEALFKHPALKILLYPVIAIRRFGLKYKNSIKNEVLENLATVLAEDPLIKVKEFNGIFAVGSKSDLFKRVVTEKEYELELSKVCISYVNPNRDAIDIGANIGFYTVLISKFLNNQRVLSIEPTPNAFARLSKNIQINEVQNKVVLFNGVVSDRLGNEEIKIVVGREEYSSMGEMIHPSVIESNYEKIKVTSKTVDVLIDENNMDPGFIKIDVEGMEHVVLKGMPRVLKHNRPVLLMELSNPLLKKNGSSSQEVIKYIENFNYKVIDPLFHKLPPGVREYGDVLCTPIS